MDEHTSWPEGVKRTKPRERVLRALQQAQQPLSAVEILGAVEKAGGSVWLSTVYRVLDLLVEKGVVTKIAAFSGDMAAYELNRCAHRHYAVCMSCKRVLPIDDCPLEAAGPLVKEGFQVVGHNLEVYGYCDRCAEKNKSRR